MNFVLAHKNRIIFAFILYETPVRSSSKKHRYCDDVIISDIIAVMQSVSTRQTVCRRRVANAYGILYYTYTL